MRKWLIILLLGDLFVILLHFFLGKELGFFNLDREQNLAAVYSGFKLLGAGGAAVIFAILNKYVLCQGRGASSSRTQCGDPEGCEPWYQSKARYRVSLRAAIPRDCFSPTLNRKWGIAMTPFLVLAGLFIYLALDEMMYLHERIGFVINHWTGLSGSRGESFWWYVYFSPLIVLGAAFLIYMWRAIKKNDHVLGRWFAFGVLFFILAIATEGLGALWYAHKWYEAYQNLFVAEEAFELIGESVFVVVLWNLAGKYFTKNFQKIEPH